MRYYTAWGRKIPNMDYLVGNLLPPSNEKYAQVKVGIIHNHSARMGFRINQRLVNILTYRLSTVVQSFIITPKTNMFLHWSLVISTIPEKWMFQ